MHFGEPTLQFTPLSHDEQARGLLWTKPLTLYHKSQPFFQKYESILPTSLTHIVLIDQRLLTLETCCGFWYGHIHDKRPIDFCSLPWRSALHQKAQPFYPHYMSFS
jgi:hypothetical protein